MIPTAEYIANLMKSDFPNTEWNGVTPKQSHAWDIKISNENINKKTGNISTRSFGEDDLDFLVRRVNSIGLEMFDKWAPLETEKIKGKLDTSKPIYANFELRIWD